MARDLPRPRPHWPSSRAESSLQPPTPPWTHHVPLLIVLVLDDEDHVKAGQDGGHEVDIILPFRLIPAAEHRVGSSQDRAAGVQGGGDPSLRETEEMTETLGHVTSSPRF